jgi:pimeloyl-ACP methyl ester carboxylesterase
MFRSLVSRLAPTFHVVAPDYPGFGQTSMPCHNDFDYSFENLTNVVETLVGKLGLTKYSIYVIDYGAPTGYRLALRHPERVQALIVQNGNAYDEGLREFWDPIKKYWSDPTTENREAIRFLVDPKSTRWQYENGVADHTLLDPTTWTLDQVGRAGPTGKCRDPAGSVLQLSNQSAALSRVPGLLPAIPTAHFDCLGQKNDFIFPPEGCGPLPAGSERCGNAFVGHRTLRAGDTRRRNRETDRRISQETQTGGLTILR